MATAPETEIRDHEFLGHQRERLTEELRTRQGVVESLESEIQNHIERGESGELPVEGYGMSETASVELDRARDQHTHALARLAEINAAFARLDAGVYGICVSCRQPIGRERLEAMPTAARCITCEARARG